MNQSMFIVWRESVEALLVIGILQAWVSQQHRVIDWRSTCGQAWCWG